MTQNIHNPKDQAQQLPEEERRDLAENFDALNIEEAWRTVAVKRLNELEKGEVDGIPAEQVFANMRARIRERGSSPSNDGTTPHQAYT